MHSYSNDFVYRFEQYSNSFNQFNISISKSTNTRQIPPSTIKSFFSFNPSIQSFVLTGFDEKFSNQYYHSLLDKPEMYQMDKVIETFNYLTNLIGNVSFGILIYDYLSTHIFIQFIAKELTGVDNGFKIKNDFIQNLTECFFVKKTCSMFNSKLKLNVNFEFTTPMQRETETVLNALERTSHDLRIKRNIEAKEAIQILMLYSNSKKFNCSTNDNTYLIVPIGFNHTRIDNETLKNAKECIGSQIWLETFETPYSDYIRTNILNLADITPDVNRLTQVDFSTWVESVYFKKNEPSIRIFVTATLMLELTTLMAGLVIQFFSIIFIKFLRKHWKHFFIINDFTHEEITSFDN